MNARNQGVAERLKHVCLPEMVARRSIIGKKAAYGPVPDL